MKRMLLAGVLLAAGAWSSLAAGEGQALSLTVTPSLDVPLLADAGLYGLGGGLQLSADYRMPFLPLLFAGANLGYSFVPLSLTHSFTPMSLASLGAAAGVRLDPLDSLSVRTWVSGGVFMGIVHDTTNSLGFNPYVSAGADVSWALLPPLSFGAGVSYRNFIGLYQDLSIFLGAAYTFGGSSAVKPAAPPEKPQPAPLGKEKPKEPEKPSGKGLELARLSLSGVFPAFFKYYNTNPLGSAVLHNWEKSAAEDIKVSFLVKQYMDNPKQARAPASLAPGEEGQVDMYGLFRSNILEVSEPTLVSANIVVEYTVSGQQRRQEITETIRINNRNAMNWADDQRAASFVTTRDPTVLKFSKNVSAMLKGKASSALNTKLLTALGVHEALRLYGIEYVVDPTTPFTEYSQKRDAVDFLQFPQQTLEYKAGDCDDLSILYCAILESVGVETAFITVPGHIYMAISLDVSADAARRLFQQPDDLIFAGGRTWLPIEVTIREGGFLKAWQAGAKEWRESQAKGLARLYPLRSCWETYEAVGFSSAVVPITMPAAEQVVQSYQAEIEAFVGAEISTRVSALQSEAKKSSDPARASNRLGILYAQYGLYDKAEKEFSRLAEKEYVPALLNLGSLAFAKNDLRKALPYYQRALKKDPKNVFAMLGVARVNHDLENYGEARAAYAAVRDVDPALAEKYAYLDLRGEEAARAAEASQVKGEILWAEGK
jgi:tetratricopeptide (TPR) repeat protein